MSVTDLEERIAKIQWWHRMELAPGVWTPGGKGRGTQKTLDLMNMPESLSGKTVLDIGSWDGFYSFEAERRGAERVLATDSFCWLGEGWGTKEGFLLAREVLDSKVEDQDIDIMDMSAGNPGVFDVVMFLGVLYHMRHPMLALEKVAEVTREMLIMETHIDVRIGNEQPGAVFYQGAEMEADDTNWWGPNPAGAIGMLRAVGFKKVVAFFEPHKPFADPGRGLGAWLRSMSSRDAFHTMRRWSRAHRREASTRMVFHAWK